MAIVTNSIGTATRDYSTLALWEAALPASAVTAGNSYVGECYNDTEFNLSTTQLVIGGTTTDATHTITLTTGPGQGFRDSAGAASNALRYNQSNGVGITASIGYNPATSVTDANVTISNLQIKNTSFAGNATCITTASSGTSGFVLDSCICQDSGVSTSIANVQVQNGGTIQNCLIICDTSAAHIGLFFTQGGSAINNTIVKPSNRTVAGIGIAATYNNITVQNCVTAGFSTAMNKGGAGTITGSGNATDRSSFGTGVSATGQTSLTIATEFVQPSNGSSVMDWRLNATAVKCNQTGTNSGAPATDIIGTTRPQGTNVCVGVWELKVTGGTRGLFLNSTLSLGAGGSFFADRLAT